MFLSRNKKNNVYPYNFYHIKVGFKGVKIKLYRYVFVMKPPKHKQRRTETEESPWNGQSKNNYWETVNMFVNTMP